MAHLIKLIKKDNLVAAEKIIANNKSTVTTTTGRHKTIRQNNSVVK